MKKSFLLGLLALACIPALSGPVFEENGDRIHLTEKACPAEIVEIAKKAGAPEDQKFLLAETTVGGKDFKACWTLIDAGRLGLVYEDGDIGMMRVENFKEKKSV